MPLAGYNPLSYFSFGKKKDSSEVAESPEQLERSSARSSAHADTASSAAKDSAQSSVDTDAEQEPLLKVVKGSPTPEEIAAPNRCGGDDAGERHKQERELAGGCCFAHLEPRSAPGCFVASGPRFVEARSPQVTRADNSASYIPVTPVGVAGIYCFASNSRFILRYSTSNALILVVLSY